MLMGIYLKQKLQCRSNQEKYYVNHKNKPHGTWDFPVILPYYTYRRDMPPLLNLEYACAQEFPLDDLFSSIHLLSGLGGGSVCFQ